MSIGRISADSESAAPETISLGGLSQDVAFALRFAQLAVFKDLVTIFRPYDIRPGQYAALKIIQANPGLLQGQLGSVLNIQKPNLAALVADFERRGLVTKERMEGDGRLRALTLTAEGMELMGRVALSHEEHRARINRILTPDERRLLIDMLERLNALCDDCPDEG